MEMLVTPAPYYQKAKSYPSCVPEHRKPEDENLSKFVPRSVAINYGRLHNRDAVCQPFPITSSYS